MTNYKITNRRTGLDLGTYAATSPDAALDAMARDAGYDDYDAALHAESIAGYDEDYVDHSGPLTVVEVAS